ncbi:TilS substrate-binding domain-containing protein, partial [Isoptericola sp. NPDC057391]|uniref:TilS substrate-binding domain-containing protein n=1 Tax=Isoptericola sp. NPDC057391 TaxID=3346117 RepID=UPI003638681E
IVPARTRVRGAVVPVLEDALGPGVVEALARTADQLRADAAALEALAADLLAAATRPTGDDALMLDVGTLAEAHAALRRRALRAAALAVGCPSGATTARHVDALDALVVSWRGQGAVHLPGDARALRACGRLYLRPAEPRPAPAAHPPAPTPPLEE